MAGKGAILRGKSLAAPALGLLLAACASGPAFNLAEIPDAPPVSSAEENAAAIAGLTEDRARTAGAAADVRLQPFAIPDPAPPFPPGF